MSFKRRGRPNRYFQGRTRTGWKQLCTGTPNKALADRIEAMWERLATYERAWSQLDRVTSGALTIGQLYDAWIESDRNVIGLQRRLDDADIEPLVDEWNKVLGSQFNSDWPSHALTHVRVLIPEGVPRPASTVTTEWLTKELANVKCARNTRRKYHSSWSVFFAYCTDVKRAFPFNPMLPVERPKPELKPPMFYDVGVAERIVDWQPDDARKAFFALVYGTGADISPALQVTRDDVDHAKHEVRIRGTKTGNRDRIALVADWAWPTFWRHAKEFLPLARLFPAPWNRWTVADWHRQTVSDGVKDTHGNVVRKGLSLPMRFPARHARHHVAVRMLRAGTPVEVVAAQLGSTKQVIMKHYGNFIPSAADRAKWERKATADDKRRKRLR
jgi:integrase